MEQTNGVLIEEVTEDIGGVYTFKTKLGFAIYYIVDNVKRGNLRVKKIDKANNNPLKGAIFTLTDISDSTHQYTSTETGVDGIATFINVEYGEYKLIKPLN